MCGWRAMLILKAHQGYPNSNSNPNPNPKLTRVRERWQSDLEVVLKVSEGVFTLSEERCPSTTAEQQNLYPGRLGWMGGDKVCVRAVGWRLVSRNKQRIPFVFTQRHGRLLKPYAPQA